MSSQPENSAEYWSSHASFYHSRTKGLLGPPGESLLEELDSRLPFGSTPGSADSEVYVLDDGAGSGNTTITLKTKYPRVRLLATDIAPGMLETLRDRTGKEEGWAPIETRAANAEDLHEASLADAIFSHVVSAFMIYFCDNPSKAVAEMFRVLRPDGVVGIATFTEPSPSWRLPWQETVREFFSQEGRYDPKRVEYKSPYSFPMDTYEPRQMREMMVKAGFEDVSLRVFDARFEPMTADAAVELFYQLGYQNPGVNVLFQGFRKEEIEAMKPTFRKQYLAEYGENNERQHEKILLTTARKPKR
ncbi:hypothetical protein LTR62_005265 [Meristemomyces frigidus]|uniref:Methyltransferase type 11 domain-containing protein n=1 Tax=Meristemomyces frigidus TaxID=1508187 RepID=A0AAN7TDM0_9PEZI|nr:hypothetical protein LTR62_005265 [Meristemomyces frigidus]